MQGALLLAFWATLGTNGLIYKRIVYTSTIHYGRAAHVICAASGIRGFCFGVGGVSAEVDGSSESRNGN